MLQHTLATQRLSYRYSNFSSNQFCLAASRGAKYYDQRARTSVCLSVCLPLCLPVCLSALKNHMTTIYQIFCACCVWPWLSSSVDNTIRYVLPVLWMTPSLHMPGIGDGMRI